MTSRPLAERFIPETINLAAKLVFSPILNYGAARTSQHMLLTIRTTHQPATDLGLRLRSTLAQLSSTRLA